MGVLQEELILKYYSLRRGKSFISAHCQEVLSMSRSAPVILDILVSDVSAETTGKAPIGPS